MNVHEIAICVTFCWACIYTFLIFLFKIQAKLLEEKIRKSKELVKEYSAIPYSINWFQDRGRRKVIEAKGFFNVLVIVGSFLLIPIILYLFTSMGYALLISIAGAVVFLDDSGPIAFLYSRAVRKKLTEDLQKKDMYYMFSMLATLKEKQSLYALLAAIFFVLALIGYILLELFGR